MSNVNRYGLSRAIPEDIKQAVRKKSGFGCVVCGGLPYEYEHIDPEFKDAKEHNPDCMTLLCRNHNGIKFKRLISIDDVREFAKKPTTLRRTYADFKFTSPREHFSWSFPHAKFKYNKEDICIDGRPILSLTTGSDEMEPLLINGFFYDAEGNRICDIVDNELRVHVSNVGDFESVANRFSFMMPGGRPCLRFKYDAVNKVLNFDEINYYYKGAFIWANSEKFICGGPTSIVDYTGSAIVNCGIAINIRSGRPIPLALRGKGVFRECVFSGAPVGINLG